MRFTQLFSKTLRENQKNADIESFNLLLRAGYARQLSSGLYSYLHFGLRSIQKIEQIIREEIDAIGGNEIKMPLVHNAELWKASNRWYEIDDSLVKFKDRNEKDMVLAMTHEENVAHLASQEIESHRQLPLLIYQIQTKFRDEKRPRRGLIRVREFTMKDSYSLDKNFEGLKKQYEQHYTTYHRIFERVGLPVQAVLSDTGAMGGKLAHEFMYLTSIGEDTIFICKKSGYRANKEIATIKKEYKKEPEKPVGKVATPNVKTIKQLSNFFNTNNTVFAKTVFYLSEIKGEKKVIVAVVKGDMEANNIKLQKLLNIKSLEIATTNEITSIGGVPGYASPIGLNKSKCIIVIDDFIANSNNFITGANEENYHYINVNFGRDFKADFVGDIISAYEGALCPISEDGSTLKSYRGVEVGNIFQLGTRYSEALSATFKDVDGKEKPIVMGSYGIGIERLLACIAEEYRDEKGLSLPINIAPYQVILVAIFDNEGIKQIATDLYKTLKKDGIDVIYDDRDGKVASAGVKFKDAELIGIPIQITISKRALSKGGIELKVRANGEAKITNREDVLSEIKFLINKERELINKKVENFRAL